MGLNAINVDSVDSIGLQRDVGFAGRFNLFHGSKHFRRIHIGAPLLFDVAGVVQFLHLFNGLLHDSLNEGIKLATIDLIHTIVDMLRLGSDVLAGQAASQQTHHGVADAGRAADGAAAAADAVKGLFCALLQFATLCVGDVLHNIQALGAGLGAGVAADAGVDLGVKLHHDLLGGLYLVDVVNFLHQREEGQGSHIHIVLHLGGAGKTGLQFPVAGNAVDGSASAAEAVTASASAYKLISGIFHRRHNGQLRRNFIFLSEKEYSAVLNSLEVIKGELNADVLDSAIEKIRANSKNAMEVSLNSSTLIFASCIFIA